MRLWYLRRAVPWAALLGCCGLAVLCVAAVHRWPSWGQGLLPLALVCCAAAAGFVFDDRATGVTSVAPRGGGWRRTSRLAAVAAPLALWLLMLATAPSELDLDLAGWLLAGAAAAGLGVGVAGVAARRQVPAPGGHVAGLLAMLGMAPLVAGPFLGWDPIFWFGEFPGWLLGMWAGLLGIGVVLLGWALRPGIRP